MSDNHLTSGGILVLACVLAAAWQAPAAGATLVVNQQAPAAADTNPGTEAEPLRTISKAAELAKPGDTVLVHAGIYRERVAPAMGGEEGKPIVYTAAPGQTVHIKGSDVWKPAWTVVNKDKGVYEGKFAPIDFGKFNPYTSVLHKQPRGMTQGQVFLDGRPMRQVTSKADLETFAGSWMVNEAKDGAYVHPDCSTRKLEDRLVELTVRGRIFAPTKRGLGYITVRGFLMEHCANDFPQGFYAGGIPQAGALGTRAGHHWVIEDNVIRYAHAIGLDCGGEGQKDYDGQNQPMPPNVGFHLIRNNVITDNGNCGIAGYRALHTKIIGNVIQRNNWLTFDGAENGGMKAHFFIGGLIEGNLFRDNEVMGLWLDNVWANTRVTRNVFVNNTACGMMFEMGGGPALVDNNIVAYTRGTSDASGIYAHDTGGLMIVHNLLIGNGLYGVYIRKVTGRSYAEFPPDIQSWATPKTGSKPCIPINIKVFNNIMYSNSRGALNFPWGPAAKNNMIDYNVYNSGGMMSWMQFMPFVVNTNGGLKLEEMLPAYDKALADNKIPPDKWPRPILYHKGPVLNFEQWQLLTGFDRHSLVPSKTGGNVGCYDLTATVTVDQAATTMGCPAIEGVDVDFLGNPMPANPLPGPFQTAKPGNNRFDLWPVPEVNRDDWKGYIPKVGPAGPPPGGSGSAAPPPAAGGAPAGDDNDPALTDPRMER